MSNKDNRTIDQLKVVQLSAADERKMRLMANLIIDRIFEDKKNNVLKFRPDFDKQQNEAKKHVNQAENNT
jgi:hypothetical protein